MKNIKNYELRIKNCRKNKIIFLLSFLFCLWSFACFSEAVSSAELIASAKQYDGKEIVYRGEVIGDVMIRGKFAWINVNDTKNAIGVWLTADLAKEVSYAGSYKTKGDIVEVKGKFNRACLEHGGDLDIHANSLQIIEKGKNVAEVISPRKITTAIVFFIICLTLTVIYFIKLGYGNKS
ncbi:MAG: DNA-binding protein [Candidatus Omnitrophica bacterium]|jgi:hypothetical protein|nr:DNA-binding protein [Candidatus Omnitrophota bacterium]